MTTYAAKVVHKHGYWFLNVGKLRILIDDDVVIDELEKELEWRKDGSKNIRIHDKDYNY